MSARPLGAEIMNLHLSRLASYATRAFPCIPGKYISLVFKAFNRRYPLRDLSGQTPCDQGSSAPRADPSSAISYLELCPKKGDEHTSQDPRTHETERKSGIMAGSILRIGNRPPAALAPPPHTRVLIPHLHDSRMTPPRRHYNLRRQRHPLMHRDPIRRWVGRCRFLPWLRDVLR